LGLFEALDNALTAPEEALLAVRQLDRAEVWPRIYCVPKLVRAARLAGTGSLRRAALEFLASEQFPLPNATRTELLAIAESVVWDSGEIANLKAIDALATASLARRSVELETLPYLELRHFAGETLLLSCLAQLMEFRQVRQTLATMDDENAVGANVKAWLAAAMDGRFGRLALRQAAEILGRIDPGSASQIAADLWKVEGVVPLLEPDLVETSVTLIFSAAEPEHNDKTVLLCRGELLGLARFRELRDALPRRRRQPPAPVLTRLGLGNWPGQSEPLAISLILWHVSLWRVLASLDTAKFLTSIRSTWTASWLHGERLDFRRSLPVHRIGTDPDPGPWFNCLRALASLRTPTDGRLTFERIALGDRRYGLFRDYVQSFLASPWIERDTGVTKTKENAEGLHARDALGLLRLFAGSWLAVRSLSATTPGTVSNGRLAALDLLLHQEHVLRSQFHECLSCAARETVPERPLPPGRQISSPLIGLALFVREQADELLRGRTANISLEEVFSGGNDNPDSARWLASSLLPWIADLAVSFSAEPLAPDWLAKVPELASWLVRPDRRLRQNGALMLRFFHPGKAGLAAIREDFAWQRKIRAGRPFSPPLWDILMGPPMVWQDWLDLDAAIHTDDIHPVIRLAAAVERALTIDESCPDQVRVAWQDDLSALLGLVFGAMDLDRYLQFRLLAVLDSPHLIIHPELPQQIVQTLVQSGRPAHLHKLGEWLLGPPPSAAASVVFRELRRIFVFGLETRLLQRRRESREPIPLRDVRRQELERRCYANWIRRFLVGAESGIETGELSALRQEFLQRRRSCLGANKPEATVVSATIENDTGALEVEEKPYHVWLDRRLLIQAVEEEDTGIFQLAYRPLVQPQERNRLGFSTDSGVLDEDGIWHPNLHFSGAANDLPIGTPVIIPLDSRGRASSARVAPSPLTEGEWVAVTVKRRREEQLAGGILSLRTNRLTTPIEFWNHGVWDADVSRAYRTEGDTTFAWATFDGQTWRPAVMDFGTLLAEHANDRHLCVTLTFIALVNDGDGEPRWHFSVQPGSLYEISPDDFVIEDAAQITARIAAEQPSASGLLISVEASVIDGRVRLLLRKTPWEGSPHIGLSIPFDDRNVRWREQFTGEDAFEAERDPETGRWFFAVASIPGFPDRVHIAWHAGLPREAEQRVEAVVGKWSETQLRTGEITARRVETVGLNLTAYGPAALYDFIQSLAEGVEIPLERTFGREPHATDPLVCLTPHGLRVPLALESVTFIPELEGTALGERVRGRLARITYLRWVDRLERVEIWFGGSDADRLSDGICEGIIAAVPRGRTDTDACQVLFRIGTETIVLLVHISIKERNAHLQIGSKLIIEKQQRKIAACLQGLRLRAIALWRPEVCTALESNAVFLGETRWERTNHWISESVAVPGLILLTPPTGEPPSHLARWDARTGWQGGLSNESIYQSEETRPIYEFEGRRCWFRILLVPTDNRDAVFAGWSLARIPGGRARMRHVGVRLLPGLDSSLIDVRREFTFTAAATPTDATEPSTQTAANREEILEALRGAPQPCEVQTVAGSVKVILLHRELSRRDATLPLAETGRARITGAPYGSEGRAILTKTSLGWIADFRAVPPMSIEELRDHLHAALGQRVDLDTFYFVGPAEGTGSGPIPTAWLFEFGYGLTLRIETPRLRHTGREFDLRGILFLGDRVRAFAFVEANIEGETVICLDIADVAFQAAPATILFNQAKRHVVHILRLRYEDTGPRILSIEGCDERHLGAFATFKIEYALMRPRNGNAGIEDTACETDRVVYGRLDTNAFARSHGHRVEFQPIRLTFNNSNGLRNHDIIFLKATTIEETPTRNDVFLRFVPLPEVDLRDIGTDFSRGVRVTRRAFSGREGVLRRQFRVDPNGIHDVFPVSVRVLEGSDEIRGSLMRGIPDRRTSALRDHLRQTGEPAFGVVLQYIRERGSSGNSSERLRLEFRPGIFFNLAPEELIDDPHKLREGTVVRIKLRNGSPAPFVLLPSSYSDDVYIGKQARPVVVLPLNKLLNRHFNKEVAVLDNHWWHQLAQERPLSIGDLPGTLCRLTQSNHGRIHPPNANNGIRFMSQRHPKIGWCTRDEDGEVAIVPDDGVALVGRLVLTSNLSVEFRSLNLEPEVEGLRWMDLTFADQPIRDLVTRCSKRTWSYHDQLTGYWNDRGVVWEELPENSAITGPIFFDRDVRSGSLRLRHPPGRFSHFGFPLREPVEALGLSPLSLTVAGRARVDGAVSGLWLELLPGRCLHMPSELLCWASRSRRISLGRFDWLHFAPGDEITLRAIEGQVLAPDSLELLSWRRGPRSCFGRGSTLLPVVKLDRENGGLTLGSGRFQLTLPSTDAPNGTACWLWNDNGVEEYDGNFHPGDVVLLGVDPTTNTVIVLGSNGCTAAPHRGLFREGTQEAFRNIIFWSDARVNWDGLRALIHSIGGAIPVTVESFDSTHHRVIFSFREQTATLRSNSVTLAMPLGFVSRGSIFDDDQVVLWLGRGFICWPLRDIVSGAPDTLRMVVTEALVSAKIQIWVRSDDSGEIHIGYAPEPDTQELLVGPEASAGHSESSHGWGLIARSEHSGQLYWTPSVFLGWTEMSRRETDGYFLDRSRTFRAKLRAGQSGDCFLSLVDTFEARAEAAALAASSVTRVLLRRELQKADDNNRTKIPETQAAGILVRCHMPDSRAYEIDELEVVEVERRSGGQRGRPLRLFVVDKGFRKHRLALPSSWLGGKIRQPGLREIVAWFDEANTQPWSPEQLASSSAEPWERRLCHAVVSAERQPTRQAGRHELGEGRELLRYNRELHVLSSLFVLQGLLDLAIAAPSASRREALHQLTEAADALSRRAVRSLHVEIGFRHGLGSTTTEILTEPTPLGRIHDLLSRDLDQKNIRAIHRWATFAEISLDPSLRAVSYALRCATGQLPDLAASFEGRPLLTQIVGVTRCLYSVSRATREPLTLEALRVLRRLTRDLAESVALQLLDVQLLPPLPEHIHVVPREFDASV